MLDFRATVGAYSLPANYAGDLNHTLVLSMSLNMIPARAPRGMGAGKTAHTNSRVSRLGIQP